MTSARLGLRLSKPTRTRWGALLLAPVLAIAGVAVVTLGAVPAGASSAAAFTSTDPVVDNGDHCLHGSTNCNLYDGKQYVWLDGGPVGAHLGAGTYFFSVMQPGGQSDPIANSISSDPIANRVFTVDSSNSVSYAGSHRLDGTKIRVGFDPSEADYTAYGLGYGDSPHVYIVAICEGDGTTPVLGGDCKYDAFKVGQTGSAEPANDLAITKDAAGAYDTTYTWSVDKTVDRTSANVAGTASAPFNYNVEVSHDAGVDSNVTVTGTIDVQNPNFDLTQPGAPVLPVTISGLTDVLSDGTACEIPSFTGSAKLGAFDNFFAYTCPLGAVPTSTLNNVATVTWDDQTLSNGAPLTGSSADFTFAGVSFAQTQLNTSVDVSDTLEGHLGTVTLSNPNPTDFPYTLNLDSTPGACTDHKNTATIEPSGATSSQTVTVCSGADLTVSKTATPAFTRTYGWSISKSVDKTKVEQIGGSATFNYTVTASQAGFTDSAWGVQGLITVTNPNAWEAITADVTDAIDNGGVCTVTNGTGVSVPANGSIQLAYGCTYASAPSPAAGTNTATATWNASTASTPTGTATGTAGATFATPTTRVNQTVHVTDSYAGALGTLTATDAAPFTSATYKYARTVPVPAGGCVTYPNTATITETGQTASQSVKACGPAKTGALTIGFWQNKNGQAIITGGTSTSGVCKSGTWLRGYAPFQDLGATATCAQVAAYVTNVIKAASAAGTTMNPMLKAQMLATALDVFFSDPALGGNKIAAPSPIGGVGIDLTKICKMIDGSGGTATCNASFESVSGAFGGATSLTVSQMLAYAASQSNAGGSNWYGQNKATQGLAKDAFDAINNQVAFGA